MTRRIVPIRQDSASGAQNLSEEGTGLSALLRFERLLSDLSATFVNLPSEQVDQEI